VLIWEYHPLLSGHLRGINQADVVVHLAMPMLSTEFREAGNTGPLSDVLYYARGTPIPRPRDPLQ